MTITMGPRTDITDPENLQSSFEPYGSPRKGGLGALWVAIVALVAVIGLALAAALGAFDSSSTDVDRTTIQHVDPRADSDSHRTPVAPAPFHPQAWEDQITSSAPSAPAVPTHPQAWEDQVANSAPAQPSHPQAYEEFVSPASASQPYVNSGLDPETQLEIYEQNADEPVDPREDSDHHREP